MPFSDMSNAQNIHLSCIESMHIAHVKTLSPLNTLT